MGELDHFFMDFNVHNINSGAAIRPYIIRVMK